MKKKLVLALTTAIAIATFSMNTQAGFRDFERVWVPCDYGWLGSCQLGSPESCSFVMCQ